MWKYKCILQSTYKNITRGKRSFSHFCTWENLSFAKEDGFQLLFACLFTCLFVPHAFANFAKGKWSNHDFNNCSEIVSNLLVEIATLIFLTRSALMRIMKSLEEWVRFIGVICHCLAQSILAFKCTGRYWLHYNCRCLSDDDNCYSNIWYGKASLSLCYPTKLPFATLLFPVLVHLDGCLHRHWLFWLFFWWLLWWLFWWWHLWLLCWHPWQYLW